MPALTAVPARPPPTALAVAVGPSPLRTTAARPAAPSRAVGFPPPLTAAARPASALVRLTQPPPPLTTEAPSSAATGAEPPAPALLIVSAHDVRKRSYTAVTAHDVRRRTRPTGVARAAAAVVSLARSVGLSATVPPMAAVVGAVSRAAVRVCAGGEPDILGVLDRGRR